MDLEAFLAVRPVVAVHLVHFYVPSSLTKPAEIAAFLLRGENSVVANPQICGFLEVG